VQGDVTWTYAELAAVVADAVIILKLYDIRPGDRVIIVSENSLALVALGARRRLHALHDLLRTRKVRVRKQGDHLGLGDQLGQRFKPLGMQLDEEKADTSEVTAATAGSGFAR
jgi:hypothetical protein